MKSHILLFGFVFLVINLPTGCTTRPMDQRSSSNALYHTYGASYDITWSAALKALSKYAVKVSNKDAGVIKTDFMTGQSRTEFYYSGGIKFPKDNKWKIELKLLDQSKDPDHPKVRIRIEKEEYLNPGFLEDWQKTQSDLFTEKAILYRIGRVIEIDQRVEKIVQP